MTKNTIPARLGAGILACAVAGTLAIGGAQSAYAAADATIEGVVTESGAPVDRVDVSAYRWADGEPEFEQQTETAADGSWTLEFLPDGEYTLVFGTAHSNARFALGETLDGTADLADDDPAFEIRGGEAVSDPYAETELSRLGGMVTVEIADDGDVLDDLDNAAAQLRGIDASGSTRQSSAFWADAEGTITIPRVPAGGYALWAGAEGEELAPVAADVVIVPAAEQDLGTVERPVAREGAIAAEGSPRVTGELRVGSAVTLHAPDLAPEPEAVTVRWSTPDEVLFEGAEFAPGEDLVGAPVTGWVFAHASGQAPYIGVADAGVVSDHADEPGTGSDGDEGGADAADDQGANGTGDGQDADAASDAGSGDDAGDLAATGGGIATAVIAIAVVLIGTGLVIAWRRARISADQA